MFVYQVLVHTPIWVWLLLAFLVSRGVAALTPRDVAPNRMLILPLVFLFWGVTGLIGSRGLGGDFALFVVAFAAGGAGGVALAALGPPPRLNPETGAHRDAGVGDPVGAHSHLVRLQICRNRCAGDRRRRLSARRPRQRDDLGRRRLRWAVLGPYLDAFPARACRGGRTLGYCVRRQALLASLGSAPGSRGLMTPSQGPVGHDHQQ